MRIVSLCGLRFYFKAQKYIFLTFNGLAFLLRHQMSSSIINQFFILRLNSKF